MKYVGIDLHTNRFTCCYLSDNSKKKQMETFELEPEGLRKFYSTINKETYVLVEATVNTFAFISLFKDLVKEEYIFGKEARIEIRNISRDITLSFQINMLMDTLEYMENKFDELNDEIKKAGAIFMSQIEILTSMTGISVITAIAVIADVSDISRFRNSKHFASYLRSTSRVESSNDKTIIKSTNKAGRKLSITLLSQSLNHFRDSNKNLCNFYERAKVFKKKGVVRMALCRKVITQICEPKVRQMLKKQEYHYFYNPALHEKKMAEYRRFLETEKIIFSQNIKIAA